jgi:heat shock protein HspQ
LDGPFFVPIFNYQIFIINNILLDDLVIHIIQEYQSEQNSPKFQVGDIITHKKYQYRGVIVHIDPCFKGKINWYLSNKTQPGRQQPWYFVLVDGKQEISYVAEENLNQDNSGNLVVNSMLNLFFSGYNEELRRYIRNEVPWNPGAPPDAPPPTPPPHFKPPSPPAF